MTEIEFNSTSTDELLGLLRNLNQILVSEMSKIQPLIDQIDTISKLVKQRIVESGQTTKWENVTATYVSGYSKTTWDNDKLIEYAKQHAEIQEMNKVVFVKPTAKITIK